MRPYLLFSGSTYYPSGGMDDFDGDFETLQAAKDHLASKHICNDWAHVVDTSTMKIVAQYSSGLYRSAVAKGWSDQPVAVSEGIVG